MDQVLEFSVQLFSTLKQEMGKGLKQEKFKEEIYQRAEQFAELDKSQIKFIDLLINIGNKYTVVSSNQMVCFEN